MLNRIFGTHRLTPAGPNELWVADLTFIAIARGFVYLAVILDAWSRRVVGYAVGRAIDTATTAHRTAQPMLCEHLAILIRSVLCSTIRG
jgi:transposase InsO family protein